MKYIKGEKVVLSKLGKTTYPVQGTNREDVEYGVLQENFSGNYTWANVHWYNKYDACVSPPYVYKKEHLESYEKQYIYEIY